VGSSIYCFFTRGAEQSPADLQSALDRLMSEHREDVQVLMERGRFSAGGDRWHLDLDRPDGGKPESIFGEGPAGLSINVYCQVVLVHSAERFCALYDEGMGVGSALRRLLCTTARCLGASPRIAVAAGGYGETDRADDLAYYKGGPFEEVVAMLEEDAGPPARTWDELARGQHGWYLGEPASDS
jgi:hypothetical protein